MAPNPDVEFLIREGLAVLQWLEAERPLEQLLHGYLRNRLKMPSAGSKQLALFTDNGTTPPNRADDSRFRQLLGNAFYLEFLARELLEAKESPEQTASDIGPSDLNSYFDDSQGPTSVQEHVHRFAHAAAQIYEYLTLYAEQTRDLKILNALLHGMFEHTLAGHEARARLLLRQRREAPGNSTENPARKFVKAVENCVQLLVARQLAELREQAEVANELYQAAMENSTSDSTSMERWPWLPGYSMLLSALVQFARFCEIGQLTLIETIRENLRLARPVFMQTRDDVGYWLCQQCTVSIETIYENSIWVKLAPYQSSLPVGYLQALVESGVLELWPCQVEALERFGILEQTDQRLTVGIAAAPQSGRTQVAEFLIAQALTLENQTRCIYVVQYSADVHNLQERFGHIFEPLSPRRFRVSSFIGSHEISAAEARQMAGSSILIVTPTKLDAMIRQKPDILRETKLIILDHLDVVCEGRRGTSYEMLVARLKLGFDHIRYMMIANQTSSMDKLLKWLSGQQAIRVDEMEWQPTELLTATYEHRTGHLDYAGLDAVELQRSRSKKESVAELALRFNRELGPVLVIAIQARYAESVAQELYTLLERTGISLRSPATALTELEEVASLVEKEIGTEDIALARYVRRGFGLHHSGVPSAVRRELRKSFEDGKLAILIGTMSLAEGTHFPSKIVLIPYLNFDQNSALTAFQFQTIAGKSRDPRFNGEGHVILYTTERRGTADLRELYFEPSLDRLRLSSAFGSLVYSIERKEHEGEYSYYSFQSQLVSAIGENGQHQNQALAIAKGTYYVSSVPSRRTRFRKVIDGELSKLADPSLPPHLRAIQSGSAYQLTEFGAIVRETGLSHSSCIALFHYVEDRLRSQVDFLEQIREPSSADFVRQPYRFCLSASFITKEAQTQETFDLVKDGLRTEMLQDWLEGVSINDLAHKYLPDARQSLNGSQQELTDDELFKLNSHLLTVSDYVEKQFKSSGAAALYAFALVLGYYVTRAEARGFVVSVDPDVYNLSLYLKHRTTNPIACYLAEIGISDEKLIEGLTRQYPRRIWYDPNRDWQEFSGWLKTISRPGVQGQALQLEEEDITRVRNRIVRFQQFLLE